MTCTPPWSRYRTWNSLVSSGASSTKSVAERRVSNVFPVTRFRSRTWTNARRLPGVRCVKSITRHGCPESRMTCPRLMSVAFIERLPEMETARATRWPTRQGRKPAPRALRVQRGEPHLPVEPRHVRLREPRAAGEGARLPTELVFLPGHAVPAAFDHDLRPLGRHHPEQPVAVDRAQRRHGAEQRVVEGP